MKNAADNKTADLLPGHDLAGERPVPPTKEENARARIARYRAKHGVPMTVYIEPEVYAAFEALCIAKDKKKSAVIQRLIETQLLRKR